MRLQMVLGVVSLIGLALTATGCATGGDSRSSADAGVEAGDDSGRTACQPPRVICGDLCVDPATNPDYCGDCITACQPGQVCAGGRCGDTCLQSETLCDGECAFVDTDLDHCGRCGNACATGQQCLGGSCRCPDGETLCDGACVDTDGDKTYCGDCQTACKVDEACESGLCVPACAEPAVLCGGLCVDVRNNNNYCGDCDTQCGPGEACNSSECICGPDQRACGDDCVDVTTNTAHCGDCDAPCPTGALCRDGDCDCPIGRTLCDEQCVDTDTSPTYCGDCETVCGSGLCVEGECVESCPDGQTICGDQCVDTRTDSSFCGDCDTACRADQDCVASFCACPDGTDECAGRCVDTNGSETYCGDCATSCADDEVCVDGECGCVESLTLCDGSCVDTDTSGRHCGDCFAPCGDLEVCQGGACTCIAGLDPCGGDCVQIGVDSDHCLGCNLGCADGEVCEAGACELSCSGALVACDGACVDTASNPLHCGDCGRACAGWESCGDSDCNCVNDFWEYEFPAADGSFGQSIPLPIGILGDSPHLRDLRLCGEDTDWYSLYLPSPGASLEIFLDADCLDAVLPRMSLWNADASAEIVADEADGSGACPVLAPEGLEAGWVNLKIENTAGEGTYDLFVFPSGLTEVEPNEDPDSATGPFDADVDVAGEVSVGTDFDTFSIYNARPASVTLETSDGGGSCDFDTVLFVTDALGTGVADDDDGGTGACSRLDLDLPAGVFFVTVFGYSAEDLGSYTLAVRYAWEVEAEPNDDELFEGPFTSSFGVEGVVFPAFDRDDYRIELAAAASLRATVSSNGFGCYIDSVLSLADAGIGLELGGDDDYDENADLANLRGTGYCSVIDPTADTPDHSFAADLAPGVYTLTVSSFSDRTGPYVLSVEILE